MRSTGAKTSYIAKGQLQAMNQTVREAHTQNMAQQRATLEVKGSPYVSEDKIGIPIINTGRLPATMNFYRVLLTRLGSTPTDLVWDTHKILPKEIESTIPINRVYYIGVKLPETAAALLENHGICMLEVYAVYNDGFTDQRLASCFILDRSTSKWEPNCVLERPTIDFSKITPTTEEEEEKGI